jgi:proline iminopeptidase
LPSGDLDVGDGNAIHWETFGNADGHPAVVLHGGPGSGASRAFLGFFDLERYRVVLFDQRGCGRSRPHASDPLTDMSTNTTAYQLHDIERLREHLGIERWLVLGLSWGSTLGLAYAERVTSRVSALVLVGVTTGRWSEIDWLYGGGLADALPAQWERFRAAVPEALRDGDLVEAYHQLLEDPEPEVRAAAAEAWTAWDWSSVSRDPDAAPPADPAWQLARARLCTHYFHHRLWLDDGALLRNVGALADVPGAMIHGRHDLQGPASGAIELARVWPSAELVIVEDAGHSSGDTGMTDAVLAATTRLAR